MAYVHNNLSALTQNFQVNKFKLKRALDWQKYYIRLLSSDGSIVTIS